MALARQSDLVEFVGDEEHVQGDHLVPPRPTHSLGRRRWKETPCTNKDIGTLSCGPSRYPLKSRSDNPIKFYSTISVSALGLMITWKRSSPVSDHAVHPPQPKINTHLNGSPFTCNNLHPNHGLDRQNPWSLIHLRGGGGAHFNFITQRNVES
jgi:hypothetical protein